MARAAPKVSILIPTYNQATLVRGAVESALRQDDAGIEVVVSDDASDDATPDVLAAFHDPRLRLHRQARNLGRVAHYRRCLYEYATGDWVLMLDGDDALTDDRFVGEAIRRAEAEDDVVLVVGGERCVEPDGTAVERLPTKKEWETVDGVRYFFKWRISGAVVPHLASLYRRRRACEIDFYRHDVLSSDWESLRRLALRGRVLLRGRPVGVWRAHGANASRSLDVSAHLNNLTSILAPAEDARALGSDPAKVDDWMHRTLAEYAREFVRASLLARAPDRARDFLAAFQRQHPKAHRRFLATTPLDVIALARRLTTRPRRRRNATA